jgi:hippurate hydrolase
MNKRLKLLFSQILLVAGLWAHSSHAMDTTEATRAIVDEQASELLATFKHIHENPELGFQEIETARLVADHFNTLGYQVQTGIAKTGVVGVLENGPGPVVLFRSDMDALPVEELVDVPYKSKKVVKNLLGETVPVMHACGHDAHVTWLMGVASVMMQLKEHWSGTLVLVAQPAEEPMSGAQAMVNDGLLDTIPAPDYIISGHQMPFWPVGSVALAGGYRMAGADQFDVVIHGVGGHGSQPHRTIDPVVMASQAVMDYQLIVSRHINPSKPAVLTVGAIRAGFANNVIPELATLKLNLRWYEESVRDEMMKRVKLVTDNIAKMHGVSADRMPEYIVKSRVDSVFNDEALYRRAAAAMKKQLGSENVRVAGGPRMASEDFQHLGGDNSNARVLMVEVGSGPKNVLSEMEKGNLPVFPHNPSFYMEPEAVLYGSEALSAILLDLLGLQENQ